MRTSALLRISLVALLAACLLTVTAWAQNDVHAIAGRVDQRYNNLQSLEAQFTETYRGTGISRVESGTLLLKKPGKMRWDYREPRAKLFVSDGKTAWFYVPGEQQVRRAPVKKLDDLRSPLRYLLGKTKLEKEFRSLSLVPDVKPIAAGDVVLRGVPKGMEDRVSQVLLEVTPDGKLRRIVIEETDGSTTEFQFTDQKENVPIADSRFRFTPPPGVETVEATELSQ
jgi:outer membrane lipoprotein carrier protein